MPKRFMTTLLGALLTVVLAATAAGATGADATTDFAAARAKAAARYSAPALAKALTETPTGDETGDETGDDGGEDCVELGDPALAPLIEQLNDGIREIVEGDEALAALDAEAAAAEERFFADLEAAESADEVNAAYDAYATAIQAWAAGSKARIAALKPQFGEVVATFIAGLVEAGVCEEDIAFATEDLAEGQWFVDAWQQAVDLAAAEELKAAAKHRDDALADLPGVSPRPDEPLPPDDGPGLPDTGASALPLLLGGLALISGGSTAVLAARCRRAAA